MAVIRVLGELTVWTRRKWRCMNILAPLLTRMIKAMTERGLISRARDAATGDEVILSIARRAGYWAWWPRIDSDLSATGNGLRCAHAQLVEMLIALADLAEPMKC